MGKKKKPEYRKPIINPVWGLKKGLQRGATNERNLPLNKFRS